MITNVAFAGPLALWRKANVAGALLFVFVSGCHDQAKESAQKASLDAAWLGELTERDVAEVEKGVPEGAKALSNPAQLEAARDPALARGALRKLRREVIDLNVAKSTFFAVADEHGVAIRNDFEVDTMAGANLAALFPELPKSADSGFVATTGAFPNTATKEGPDKDWLAASPLRKPDGSLAGYFVTGWSYRYYARHLYESLKAHLLDPKNGAKNGEERKVPIFYVGVFDKSGVYSAPLTPAVDEKAMKDADLVAKTAQGAYQGVTSITDRAFGYAAVRTPKIAPDTGIYVLLSDI